MDLFVIQFVNHPSLLLCLSAKFRSSNEKIRPIYILVPHFSSFIPHHGAFSNFFSCNLAPSCMQHRLSDNGAAAAAVMMKRNATKDRSERFLVLDFFASMAASLAKQIRVAVDHEGALPRLPHSPPPPQQPGEYSLTPCFVAW